MSTRNSSLHDGLSEHDLRWRNTVLTQTLHRLRLGFYRDQHKRDVKDFCCCCDCCTVPKRLARQVPSPAATVACGVPYGEGGGGIVVPATRYREGEQAGHGEDPHYSSATPEWRLGGPISSL
ncbi:unnamed protein product [Lota lota]